MTAIETPCVLVCVIDRGSDYCLGCGRSGEEIGAWIGMTPEMRRAVMGELPTRLASIKRLPRPETGRTDPEREHKGAGE